MAVVKKKLTAAIGGHWNRWCLVSVAAFGNMGLCLGGQAANCGKPERIGEFCAIFGGVLIMAIEALPSAKASHKLLMGRQNISRVEGLYAWSVSYKGILNTCENKTHCCGV